MGSNDNRPLDAEIAVLVIDVQVGLITGAYEENAVLDRINTTIGKARRAGGEVVFVQRCHTTFEGLIKGAPGWRLDPRLKRTQSDTVVEKQASDAFCATNLDDVLQARGVRRVLVTGLQTEYCVDTTIEYCKERKTFGNALIDNQVIHFRLAELQTEIECLRALGDAEDEAEADAR